MSYRRYSGGVEPPGDARREVLTLAWPVATAMLGDVALGLVDTKLVGGLGARALAGVGLATVLLYLCQSLIFGLMRGVKVRSAFCVGEGRPGDARRYLHAGLALGSLAGVGVFLLSRDAGWVLRALRVEPQTAAFAQQFLSARAFGAPFTAMLSALVQYRQGIGSPRAAMVVGLMGNAFNALLGFGLVYGHFGLPSLGVAGAGYATAMTEVLEVLALAWVCTQDRKGAAPRVPLRTAAREVLGLGVPTGAQFALESLAFTAFTAVLGSIGPAELAAHHVALSLIRASFLPGLALSEAASVLVGRSLGAGDPGAAQRAARAALEFAVAFMTLCGVLFVVAGGPLARAFTSDPAVVHTLRRLLIVAAVFQTFDAITIVLRGALRGAGDVRWVAVIGTTVA